jgi:hypothetical protein
VAIGGYVSHFSLLLISNLDYERLRRVVLNVEGPEGGIIITYLSNLRLNYDLKHARNINLYLSTFQTFFSTILKRDLTHDSRPQSVCL